MPFPFLRLPEGIQITILELALRQWQLGVCDLLVTCRHIHRLCIPILYNLITWRDSLLSESLLLVFGAHPEYAEYVWNLKIDLYFYREDNETRSEASHDFELDEVDFAVHFVRFLHGVIGRSSKTNDRSIGLYLNFPQDRIADVAELLQRLQPETFTWIETEPKEYRLAAASFGAVTMQYPGMNEWFPRIQDLNIQDSVLDAATAHLFAHLPNVKELAVGLAPHDNDSARKLARILLSPRTSKTLKLQVRCHDVYQRRQVQCELGVCLELAEVCDEYEELVCGCGERPMHGCKGFFKPCNGCTEAHELVSRGLTTTCPRCCVLAGQGEPRMAKARTVLEQFITASGTFRMPFKGQHTLFTHNFPHGLCPVHYNEFFVQTHEGEPGRRARNLLGRRALECMFWC